MRFYCPIFALLAAAAFAQNRPVSATGTVESVSGNVVNIRAGERLLALATDARTEIWKGNIFHDLSAIEAGDTVIARYRTDASGKHIAEGLWFDITNFDAVITKLAGSKFEVLTNPNADPQSAYKKQNKIIEVDADTLFEASAREDLQPGRNVHVLGLGLKDGEVRATRITVYEGNRPVRMRPDAVIISPDGSRR